MSFLRKFATAVLVGAAVYMTGGLAAGGLGLTAGVKLSTLAVKGALFGGLSFVSGYLGRPKANRQAVNARLNLSVDPNALGKIVYGETALATDVVYNEQIGDTKVFYVVAGAMHEIDSFGKFYIDDEEIEFDVNNQSTGDWEGVITIYRRTGQQEQSAIDINISQWPSTARGRGIAHYGLMFDASSENGQKKLAGGVPSRITHVAKGAKVYDPRKDTTRGGTGSHRVDDQSTWEFSGNWALVVANYLIGVRLFDNLVYGVGVEPDDIDWQQVADMADVCDTQVDGKPKYHIGGILDITNDHEQTIGLLESAVDGKVSRVGGKYYIWCPHDDTANVKLTITDDDIVSEQGIVFSPTDGLTKLYNTARGQYVSPDELFQLTAYPQVEESTAVTEDGKQRILTYDLTMIQEESVAQRIARERIRRSRFTASISMLMGPRYIALKPFDIVEVNVKETNNQTELFRVVSINGSVNGFAQVELIEEDASIYDTSAALGPSLTQLSPSAYNPTQTVTPVNVQAANVVVQGTGSAKDAIRVTWNDPGAFVRETEVRFRINSTSTDYEHSIANFSSSIVISPVEPVTEYDLQVRHITREGVFSDWIQVIHTSGDETLNVIRPDQADAIVQPVIEDLSEKLVLLNIELGGLDGVLEQIAQDINNELAIVDTNTELRQVRIDNVNQIIQLVNEYLDELEGETLPELAARLAVAEDDINNLQVVVIPAIDSRLNTAENSITVLNGTTIPQLQSDLGDVDTRLDTLNSITLPLVGQVPVTIDNVLEELAQDISEIVQRSQQIRQESDERKGAVDELNSDIDTLNNTTLPALNNSLSELEGLFPIEAVSISDDAITAPKILAGAVTTDKMTANSINGDRIAANTLAANKIVANSIGADRIAANAITTDKLDASAVTADKIAALAVSAEKIAALAITAEKIAADAVTADKIQANAVTAVKIAANAVEADKITANAVTADKIAANAVTADKVAANSISADKIVSNSITAAEIAADTITGNEIAARSIGAEKIVAESITAEEIAALSISGDKIAGNTISGDKIIANTITGNEIAANTITGDLIQANTITGDEIDANTITAANIAANTITGDEIAANTITALQILSRTITAEEIKADTITANEIASDTITANEITAATITALQIAANTITANEIAAGTITADEIAAQTITADKLVTNFIYSQIVQLVRSGKRLRLDPSSDLIFWFGDDSVTVGNQSKSNGNFWIAADGSYRSNIRRRSSQGVSNFQSTDWVERSITLPSVQGTAGITGTASDLLGFDVSSATVTNLSIEVQLRRGTTVLGSSTIPVPTSGTGFNQSFELGGVFFNVGIDDDNTGKNYNDTTGYNIRARLQGNNLSTATTATARLQIVGLEISDV